MKSKHKLHHKIRMRQFVVAKQTISVCEYVIGGNINALCGVCMGDTVFRMMTNNIWS